MVLLDERRSIVWLLGQLPSVHLVHRSSSFHSFLFLISVMENSVFICLDATPRNHLKRPPVSSLENLAHMIRNIIPVGLGDTILAVSLNPGPDKFHDHFQVE